MAERAAGVLLHPTSLPNRVLDQHAWRFLDWMQAPACRFGGCCR